MANKRAVYRFTGFYNHVTKQVVDPTFEVVLNGKRQPMKSVKPELSYAENVALVDAAFEKLGWAKEVFKTYNGMRTKRGQFFERMVAYEQLVTETKPVEEPKAEIEQVEQVEQVDLGVSSEEEAAFMQPTDSELFWQDEELQF